MIEALAFSLSFAVVMMVASFFFALLEHSDERPEEN